MVVACRGRQLLKSGKCITFSKKLTLGPSNNSFGYHNYFSLCLNSVPKSRGSLGRLWCNCRRLHYSKETTRSVLAKLSPQEVCIFTICCARPEHNGLIQTLVKSENLRALPKTKTLETHKLSETLRYGLIMHSNVSEVSLKSGILSRNRRGISTKITTAIQPVVSDIFSAIGQLYSGVISPILLLLKNVWIGNLLTLFATLNHMPYLWSLPNIYLPLLVSYVSLLIVNGTLYLVINTFSEDPDSFLVILDTFWGSFVGFLWSFLPF